MKAKSSLNIALTAVFAAIYSIGVVFLAPISFQVFQVRVADALLPLAMLFGWPAVLGLSLGAFVANIFGGLGPIDMVGGSVANFIATFVAWRIATSRGRRWALVGVGAEIVIVTLVVGTYLSYLLAVPLEISWLGVFLGSLTAIGVLGSILFFALSTDRIAATLRTYGLGIYTRQTEKK
jgi:uncharacterized membrane protein